MLCQLGYDHPSIQRDSTALHYCKRCRIARKDFPSGQQTVTLGREIRCPALS